MQRQTQLANELWPLLQPKVRTMLLAATGASGSGSGGGTAEHELGGGQHKGTLRDDQAPQFLKADGSRPLTGNLVVGSGVLVDGVDISAHASNPDAHHARQHGILSGADHSVTGSAWDVVGLTAVNTLGLIASSVAPGTNAALLRTDANGQVTPYTLGVGSGKIRSDAVITLRSANDTAYQNLVAFDVSALNNLFVGGGGIYSNTAVGLFTTGAAAQLLYAGGLLASNDYGHASRIPANGIYSLGAVRTDTAVQTPLLTTFAGDLTINPASGTVLVPATVTLRSAAWTPGVLGTGWGLQDRPGQPGRSHLDIRSIYTDELIATTFTADQVRVRSGSDWLGESLAIAARDNSDLKVTIPTVGSSVRIYVENAPEVSGQIFDENEHVLIKTINRGSGLVIRETWGQVSSYQAEAGNRQSYLWTTRSGGGNFVLEPGTALTGFGASSGSYIFRTVVEAGRGPYERFATWSGNPYTPANRVSRVEIGDIRNAIGDATTRYGIAGGNNLALTPATGFSGFSADNVYGFRLYNASQYLYQAGTLVGTLTPTQGLNLLAYTSLTPPDEVRQIGWLNAVPTSEAPIASMFGAYYLASGLGNDAFVLKVARPGQWSNAIRMTAYNNSYATQAEFILQSWAAASGTPSYAHIQAQDITFSTAPKVGVPGLGNEIWHRGMLVSPLDLNSFNGVLKSSGTVSVRNLANTAYQNLVALDISAAGNLGIVGGGIYSDTAIGLLTTGALAQRLYAGGLMASNDYGQSGRIPANGIYSLGAIAIGDALTAGYMLDVNGAARVRNNSRIDGAWYFLAVTTPGASAGMAALSFDGSNFRVRLPDGSTRTLTMTSP